MLFLVAFGLAHAPHDVVDGIAVPYDLSDSGPWWVTGYRSRATLFNYSRDAGANWYTSSPPAGSTPSDLCMMSNGDVLALASPRYFYSTDDGSTFTTVVGPVGTVDIACGTSAWLAGSGGIYVTSDPSVAPTLSQSGNFVSIRAFLDDVSAIDSSGNPWVWDATAGTWSSLAKPGGRSATALSPDGAYAGTRTGTVYAYNSSRGLWSVCGALPSATSAQPEVQALVVDGYTGATLLAGASYGGPYASTDGCATWTSVLMGEQPYFERPGRPSVDHPTWREIYAYDGKWVTAGWAGVWYTEDGGATWPEARWFTAEAEASFAPPPVSSRGPVSAAEGWDLDRADDAEETAPGAGCAAGSAALMLVPLSGLLRRRRRSTATPQ